MPQGPKETVFGRLATRTLSSYDDWQMPCDARVRADSISNEMAASKIAGTGQCRPSVSYNGADKPWYRYARCGQTPGQRFVIFGPMYTT